ncbi:MAG TPA: hypothetical protein EYP80_01735 [Candidatus Aenigmarchaeota archaeon]|nr:hypothetical protein [Candidatus Aenigmarchaeota archaeon]
MVSIFEARKLAVRYGLGLQYILKEFRIFDILQKIKPLFLDDKVITVFKGGTALNKVYFQKKQRFSEDLDFDIVFKKIFDKKQKIKYIESKITSFLPKYSLDTKYMRNTIRITCSFLNELERKDNVFLEFHLEDKIVGEHKLENIRSKLIKKICDSSFSSDKRRFGWGIRQRRDERIEQVIFAISVLHNLFAIRVN